MVGASIARPLNLPAPGSKAVARQEGLVRKGVAPSSRRDQHATGML